MATDVVEKLLDGAVDMHVHPYPSPFPRRLDAAEAAQRAADAGMRAIVVKSHHHDTAMDVAALREHGIDQSGIEVYGGIALNTQVGGLNPHAVNLCLAMGGKVVWFPTIASPKHIEHHRAHPQLKFPQLAVDLIPEEPVDVFAAGDGQLKPEVHEILKMISDADAVLASGHMPAQSTCTSTRTPPRSRGGWTRPRRRSARPTPECARSSSSRTTTTPRWTLPRSASTGSPVAGSTSTAASR